MSQEFNDRFSETQKSSSIIVNQTYSYINNTGFYALANPAYYSYYYRFARRYGWWYDRYVPDFHNAQQGYFSTGIAHSLVDGIANLIVGRKLLLQSSGYQPDTMKTRKVLKGAYKWCSGVHFTDKVRNATKYAGALGTSLLKLNVSNGELWLDALRFDDFFFETDFRGKLIEITCLIKSYTDTDAHRTVDWGDCDGETPKQYLKNKFYLVEKRYFKEIEEFDYEKGKVVKKNIPYGIYQIHRYTGNITNAQSWNMSLQEEIRYDSLPSGVKKALHRDFGGIMLGKEMRLPFVADDLGCQLFRYNGSDCSLSQQPFGESILSNILSDLMAYDIAFSYAFRDMYQGKGIVFMPKELQTNNAHTPLNGLEDSLVTWVQAWSDEGKLPIAQVQFNMRVQEWREKNNALYETIAMKLNISPTSIAGFLSDNTARTAKEVSTETSATDNYIDIQRGCLEDAINGILESVGKFYGWEDVVEVRFGKAGSQNTDAIIDRVVKLKQAGLITPYEALKQIMTDADEWDIEDAYAKLTAYNDEQSEKQANLSFGMDFGDTSISGGGINAN